MLANACALWERYAEANRRFVEERSEQLKSFANLGALITGFAIVAFLQVQGPQPPRYKELCSQPSAGLWSAPCTDRGFAHHACASPASTFSKAKGTRMHGEPRPFLRAGAALHMPC